MGLINKIWIKLSMLKKGCFVPKNDMGMKRDTRVHVLKQQYSSSRLSLSDLSESGSPFSFNDLSISLVGSDLHVFTLGELKEMTQGFSQNSFIGEGGFGSVHKGFIHDKLRHGLNAQPVAVKRLDLNGNQGDREWLAEIIFLGQLQHRHLLKLIGYCWEDEHRLLVYEYMPRGSLDNQLFGRHTIALPWKTRIKIALDAANGLAFLHGEYKPVIYRDLKSSNILLDADFTAKLSDFGLAKDGPEGDETHVSTRVMGTHGYAAPEYVMTGHLTTKSDVYSFGVVLLELLTGRKAVDKNRPTREHSLVDWARSFLKDPRKLGRLVDPRLEGEYSIEGASKVATLACRCLSRRPKYRPTMAVVIQELESIMDLNDNVSIGHFVYVVPNGSEEEKVDLELGKKKVGKEERAKKKIEHRENGFWQNVRV